MDYFDANGNYDRSKVIEGIAEIDDQIQELCTQDAIDKSRLTRLRYEEMLRGLYMFWNPYT
jgi:hypothetical protein